MERIRFRNSNNKAIILSAIMSFPPDFDSGRVYPAVIVCHPYGGVKEQTAGPYALLLAEHGFVTIAYDASYQGESGGLPRQLENPHIRAEDISAVIDYLITLPYIDKCCIGAMGICAGGGYTVNAAVQDRRIKALAAVSIVNIGAVFRQGWRGRQNPANALRLLEAGSEARTQEALGSDSIIMPLEQIQDGDVSEEERGQIWEYYNTPRGEYPTAPGFSAKRSLCRIAAYDAYAMAEFYLTQPLLLIAGSKAGTKWMSDDLMRRAVSKDKHMHSIAGANHMDLYDKEPYVSEAVNALAEFFTIKLTGKN